jgi:hypothetical protein
VNGKNSGLSAKYAVFPSGVNVIRHCSLPSEMTFSAKISGVERIADRVARRVRRPPATDTSVGDLHAETAKAPVTAASVQRWTLVRVGLMNLLLK